MVMLTLGQLEELSQKNKVIAKEIASLETVLFQVPRVDDDVGQHSVISGVGPPNATGTHS